MKHVVNGGRRTMGGVALAWAVLSLMAVGCRGAAEPDAGDGSATETVAGEATDPGDAAAGTPDAAGAGDAASTAGDAAEATAGPSPTADPAVVELIQNFKLPAKGSDDALVTMYTFSDYACPYCQEYDTETADALEAAYVDTGRVRVIYWDFPLPGHGWPAIIAAEATHCAEEQGLYWETHDALFADWDPLVDVAPEDKEAARAGVLEIVESVDGLDAAAMTACLEAEKYQPVLGVLVRQAGEEFKIRATPSFALVTDEHVELIEGALPFEGMSAAIDREISRALGTPIPDPTATTAP